jgi:hypothetical protein
MADWLHVMSATLIAEITSADQFAGAAQGWLAGTVAEAFAELWRGLRSRPVVRAGPRKEGDLYSPWGQPDHVLGELKTYRRHPVFGRREVLYSAESWKRFLAGLAKYPFAVQVSLNPLDGRGYPLHRAWPQVTAERDFDAPSWASFTFNAPAEVTGWPESAKTQNKWAEFLKRQAARIGACAGSVTDDIGPSNFALQRTTPNFSQGTSVSREVLRGYTWVTVLAAELAARLGGAAALKTFRIVEGVDAADFR